MKFFTLLVLFGSALAIAANLVARQVPCSEDNCYRAVWGNNDGADHPLTALRDCMSRLTTTVAVFPVTTITVVARNTTTAVVSCSTTPASSATSSLTASASSLPDFSFPTPTPTSSGSAAAKVKAHQNEVLSSSTTTIIGPIPTYASVNCLNLGPVFASACSCKGVTQDTLTKLSTTLTNTDTLTLTSTVTSTALCSTAFTITLSRSSSTTVTTFTMTSNPDDTSTGSPTGSSSSVSSSSSPSPSSNSSSSSSSSSSSASSTTDTATSPSISLTSSSTSSDTATSSSTILTTTSTTLDTTMTSTTSSSPTPTCSGLGTITCNGTCHDAKTDRLHCGRCGNACASGLDCVNGVCARQPCDSTCEFDRFCNSANNATAGCKCATDTSAHGICFDKDRYNCGNANLTRCLQTEASLDPTEMGCPVGMACIKDICNCGGNVPDNAKLGVCVTTEGCGDSGTLSLGPLVRIGDQERRRRMVGEYNW